MFFGPKKFLEKPSANRRPPFICGGNAAWHFGIAIALLLAGQPSLRAISVTDTTGWNAWYTQQGAVMTDPGADQQTGQGQDDFIGSATTPGFQQKAGYLDSDPTNEYLIFRVRMGKYDSQHGFGGNLSLGIDLTGNGTLNLIMDMQDKNGAETISFASPGAGANNSPSTTTWGNFNGAITLDNNTYNYQAATDGTLNSDGTGSGGQNSATKSKYTTNAWVTFAISYANLQAAIQAYAVDPTSATPSTPAFTTLTVDDFTALSFVAFTSTQGNAINQDLFGTDGNTNSSTTFGALGAGTPQIRPGGGPIPEPASMYQLGGLLGIGLLVRFWRHRRAPQRKPSPSASPWNGS